MSQLFLNNFQTQFIANVKSAPETGAPAAELDYGILRVSDGAAGVLLNPGAGNWYVLTAFKRTGTLEHSHEVMRITLVDNSVVGECRLTVSRGQEGTPVTAFTSGDMLELRLTAGGLGEYAQKADPRLDDARVPKGPAGGVLSGSYPNPEFAQAMATAADLTLKVDKVAGKGLSTNDFANADVAKLAGIAEQATKNAADAQLRDRSTHTGAQPISSVTGLQDALDAKVSVVAGKALSTNDYTTAEKNKLAGIAAAATANATDAQLRDRTTHTGAQAISTITGLQAALDAKYSAGNVLGTVSQLGGIPTGAIIQRGNNANGDFVRFADGTQICTLQRNVASATYVTAPVAITGWTFPAAFSYTPVINVRNVAGYSPYTHIETQGTQPTDSGGIYVTAYSGTTTVDLSLSFFAIGRWF